MVLPALAMLRLDLKVTNLDPQEHVTRRTILIQKCKLQYSNRKVDNNSPKEWALGAVVGFLVRQHNRDDADNAKSWPKYISAFWARLEGMRGAGADSPSAFTISYPWGNSPQSHGRQNFFTLTFFAKNRNIS